MNSVAGTTIDQVRYSGRRRRGRGVSWPAFFLLVLFAFLLGFCAGVVAPEPSNPSLQSDTRRYPAG